MTEGWVALSVEVPEEAADAVANFLHEHGALGVITGVMEPGMEASRRPAHRPREARPAAARGDTWRLEAHLPAAAAGSAAVALRRYLTSLSTLLPDLGRPAVRCEPLASAHWDTDWRVHFRPAAVGSRLLVAPPWEVPRTGDRIPVIIEPGMAFGTGAHGSTRGCLEAIEAALAAAPAPARALDVGTGSGILAIAMARLGVREVVALDTDPAALPVAAANAARNRVAGVVRLLAGGPAALHASFPLVVANLLLHALLAEADSLLARTSPAGTLIVSGVTAEQVPAVERALGGKVRRAGEWVREEWVTVSFQR